MLYLRTFGGLSVLGSPPSHGGAAAQRKPLALLALLAASEPMGLTRDQVLAFLWPERDEEHGRRALRQTLHALRRALSVPELFLGSADLRLNPEVLGSDVAELGRASRVGDLAGVARLYQGPFLAGFHLAEAPEFERWTERQRSRYAVIARDALQSLAARFMQEADPRGAAGWLRQAATIEPTNGRIALELMRALAADGNRGGALQHAKAYEALVREELEAPPDPEVVALAEQLRMQLEVARVRTQPPPQVLPTDLQPAPEPPAQSPHEPSRPPQAEQALPMPSEPRGPGRPAALLFALALAAVSAIIILMDFRARQRRQADLDPAVLAVAPFEVFEPDLEEWREGMVDVLSRDLDGAGELRTVAPGAVLRVASAGVDGVESTDLGRATGAGTVLTGTLLRSGPDSVRAAVTLVDARSGVALDEVIRGDASERMERLADSLTLDVVRALAARGVAATAPRRGLRSTSLGAIKLFLRAEHHFRRAQWDSARFYYERAVAADSGLALGYRRLGHVLTWQRVNFDSVADLALLRAGALNHGLGPHDSLLIRCDSLSAAANATDDPLQSWNLATQLFRTAREAVAQYPEDPEVWYALADAGYHFGFGSRMTVPEPEILRSFDQAIAADSGFAPAYLHAIELALNTRGAREALRYIGAYLALNPSDGSEPGVRLSATLLANAARQGDEPDRILDTIPADVLSSVRTVLRAWPDSAETAIRLGRLLARGRPSSYPLFADTARMRRRLAEQLAFRGHMREAYQVIGMAESGIFAELALLGVVPRDSARAAFRQWQDARSPLVRFAFPWWAAQGEATALQHTVAHARASTTSEESATRVEASYDTAAGLAYLALARADTSEAIARFMVLPDSLCVRCYVDRLTRARLLAARGRHREALVDLQERLVAYSSPFQVVFAAERARVADVLGLDEVASAARSFVRQAWRHADPDFRTP